MLNLSHWSSLKHWNTALLYAALFGILLADSQTQLGFAHGVLYTPLVAIAALSIRRRVLNSVAGLAIIFIWLGYFLSPPAPIGFSELYVLSNRTISCLAIGLIWWFGLQGLIMRAYQLKQQNQETQTRLDLVLANKIAGLSHWQLDEHRKMVTLDHSSQRLLGLHQTEITLEQFICCFAPGQQPELRTLLTHALGQAQPETLELQTQTEPQSVWIKLIAYPDPVLPFCLRGILQNLQPHYDEARRLKQQQQRFQQLADSMPVKVWTATPQGQIDFVAETFARFTGSKSSVIVSDWLGLLHQDDRAKTLEQWQHCLAKHLPYRIEFRIRRFDGEYVWHLTSAVPIFNEQGEVLYWFGSAMDISEQKELWQQTESLRRTLFQILDEVANPCLMLDRDLKFTYINQSALDKLIPSQQQVLGKSLLEVMYQPGRDYSALTTAIQRSLLHNKPGHLLLGVPSGGKEWTVWLFPNTQGIQVLLSTSDNLEPSQPTTLAVKTRPDTPAQ